MLLEGKIFSGDHVDKIAVKPVEIRENVSLTKSLDIALVELCHELTLPSLMWFSKTPESLLNIDKLYFFLNSFQNL